MRKHRRKRNSLPHSNTNASTTSSTDTFAPGGSFIRTTVRVIAGCCRGQWATLGRSTGACFYRGGWSNSGLQPPSQPTAHFNGNNRISSQRQRCSRVGSESGNNTTSSLNMSVAVLALLFIVLFHCVSKAGFILNYLLLLCLPFASSRCSTQND